MTPKRVLIRFAGHTVSFSLGLLSKATNVYAGIDYYRVIWEYNVFNYYSVVVVF